LVLAEEQMLHFAEKMMADDAAAMGDYFIKDGSSLQLVVRLFGRATN